MCVFVCVYVRVRDPIILGTLPARMQERVFEFVQDEAKLEVATLTNELRYFLAD